MNVKNFLSLFVVLQLIVMPVVAVQAAPKDNLTAEEQDLIIEAIVSHSHSYPFRKLNKKKDHYTKILQDADTLDFFSDLRLKALTHSRNKFFFYKLIWKIGQKLYYRNKKQLNKYLNYPQLVNHLNLFS